MKKILLITAVLALAVACHKEPFNDSDNEYLVYTSPGKDVTFTSFKTFAIADSLLVIGQTDKPYYSQSKNALELITQVRDNMTKRGFVYTNDKAAADLGIQMTYVVKTERYVQYYDDDYWWLSFPGYWSPCFWGNYVGFYYPYPVTYTYSTNSLMVDMIDLVAPKDDDALEVIWSAYIGGPASSNIAYDIVRMKEAVDQAFAQSPYLSATASK